MLPEIFHAGRPGPRSTGQHTSVDAWFTEGFETLDLKQAKALLDELA
jgi:hypothetical protein